LSAEKDLPRDVVINAVEAALVSAYRKDSFAANQNISVKISPASGKVAVWAEKTVVETTADTRCEISPDEARRIKPDVQVGDTIMVEATPRNAGRIAAQTAKQVILQRLHEAEHTAIFKEYAGKQGDIITGVVQRIDLKQIYIDLGRTEAILPAAEQVRTERYRIGQRLKVCLLEVATTNKGPQVVVSRSHPDLLRRLFELEIPEILNGTVVIKSVAREAGFRSKVAVSARQEGIDPVGCCVGLRGIRIQNIVRELNGEKIDVVIWSADTAAFLANALSPAHVLSIQLGEEAEVATVVVPDRQLSLAIGKEGQNVRLAAKLTGWRIDIKSASVAEAERAAEAKLAAEVKEEAVSEEVPVAETPAAVSAEAKAEEPVEVVEIPELVEVPEVAEKAEEEEEVEPVPVLVTSSVSSAKKPQLRFAEDVFVPGPTKPLPKSKKKKKKEAYDKKSEDGIRMRRPHREREDDAMGEEDYEY
ncbi:transcription termination factor NusA, partial [Chloroflexota bacterium]